MPEPKIIIPKEGRWTILHDNVKYSPHIVTNNVQTKILRGVELAPHERRRYDTYINVAIKRISRGDEVPNRVVFDLKDHLEMKRKVSSDKLSIKERTLEYIFKSDEFDISKNTWKLKNPIV